MTTSIAQYYESELNDWLNSIEFYEEEIPEFEETLEEFLRQDSIPATAARIEHFLNSLMLHQQKFQDLREEIENQEEHVIHDNAPVQNEALTIEMKSLQRELRNRMQQAEKTYIDLKYDCLNFFDEIIGKQSE